jgi:hypothetical protein
MSEMTKAEKIQLGADLLADRLYSHGWPSPGDCLELARRLYAIWEGHHEQSSPAPGEIAQHHRERYSE